MPPRPATIRKRVNPKGINKSERQSVNDLQPIARSNPNQILKNRKTLTVPQSDIFQTIGFERSISSTYSVTEYKPIEELPELNSVPEDKFNDLLRQKLEQCCRICNFADPNSGLKDKDLKTTYLNEILEYISKPHFFAIIEPETFSYFFRMIKHNIIRSMPPVPELAKMPILGDDIKDQIFELSWPHLRITYEIFQKLLDSEQIEIPIFLNSFTPKFIHRLLSLFDSNDQRERHFLKMILFKIYLRFTQLRLLIRRAIQHVFYTYIYEIQFFSGINELLEIMHSIINGYSVPIKQEHKDFLKNLLLPLYSSNFLHKFHGNLYNCVFQYVQKDNELITCIITSLLSYWPISFSFKEIIFVKHLTKLIELINETQFQQLMVPLFHKIGKCISSYNFQVSELCMLLWKNDMFIEMTIANAEVLFPIICPYLYKTGTSHWHTTIRNEAVSVIRIFMVMAKDVFTSYSKALKDTEKKELNELESKKSVWSMLINNYSTDDDKEDVEQKKMNLDNIFPQLKNFKKG